MEQGAGVLLKLRSPGIPSPDPQHWLFVEWTQKVVQYVNVKSLSVPMCLKSGNIFVKNARVLAVLVEECEINY